MKKHITPEIIIRQGELILTQLTSEILDQIYEKSGMLAAELGENRKSNEILKQRLKYLRSYIDKLKLDQIKDKSKDLLNTRTLHEVLTTLTPEDAELLMKIIPHWEELNGENGYQHNNDHIGSHTLRVLFDLKASKEFAGLNEDDKKLAVLAGFFHDFGKPHGPKHSGVKRDYFHDEESARLAENYLSMFGYSNEEIEIIKLVIMNDGQVSDWARGKNPELTPESLKKRLNGNQRAIRILQAVNASDVRGLMDGQIKFARISDKYQTFFSKIIASY